MSRQARDAKTVEPGVPGAGGKELAATPASAKPPVQTTSEPDLRQEFYLPVHGFIWLFKDELRIVDHPAFQRLAFMNQLGQAHLVYRGATHKRIEHALGTLHMVHKMIEAAAHNAQQPRKMEVDDEGDDAHHLDNPLSEGEKRFARVAALLHDVGHVPWGHTVEDELCLLPRHDGDSRLEKILGDGIYKDRDGWSLADIIDADFARHLPPKGWDAKVTPSKLVRLLIRKTPDGGEEDSLRVEAEFLRQQTVFRFSVIRDLIGNTICADLLDYLYRDWHHIGKRKSLDDRILHYMEFRARTRHVQGKQQTDHNFVISLGNQSRFRTDAVSTILELLETRYQLAEAVYFHRTKLAAAAMLERAISLLYDIANSNGQTPGPGAPQLDLEDLFIRTPEEGLFDRLSNCAKESLANANGDRREQLNAAVALLEQLRCRQLFSLLHSHHYNELPTRQREQIQKRYNRNDNHAQLGAPHVNRSRAILALEKDCGLPIGSIAMYCPDPTMNAKIAEVKVHVNGKVQKLKDYEAAPATHHELTGGHLEAQLHRFHRLWKVMFFVDERIEVSFKDMLPLVKQATDELVLEVSARSRRDRLAAWKNLAVLFANEPKSPHFGKRIQNRGDVVAAKADEGIAKQRYPTRAPHLSTWFAT